MRNLHYLLKPLFISSRKVLTISGGIDEMGGPKWELVLCLALSWIVVYLCLIKGIKSSGKVSSFTGKSFFLLSFIIVIGADLQPYSWMPSLALNCASLHSQWWNGCVT